MDIFGGPLFYLSQIVSSKKFLRSIMIFLLPHSIADKVMTKSPANYIFRILMHFLSLCLLLNKHEGVTSRVCIVTDLQGFHVNTVLNSNLSASPSLELLVMFQDVPGSDLEKKITW